MIKIKFAEFLAKNSITWYKLAQLAGYNPLQYSGSVKKKCIGERPISTEEFEKYCQGLSQYLHKTIRPEDFETDVVEVLIKK